MPVLVVLPGILVNLFPGAVREVEVSAASVREAIDALDARWPGMRDRVCDSRPAIRRHINVFVDGDKATLDTPLDARHGGDHHDRDQRRLSAEPLVAAVRARSFLPCALALMEGVA